MTDNPQTQLNDYDDAGNLTGVTMYTYSGNFNGYPLTKQTFETTSLRNTMNFTYQ